MGYNDATRKLYSSLTDGLVEMKKLCSVETTYKYGVSVVTNQMDQTHRKQTYFGTTSANPLDNPTSNKR